MTWLTPVRISWFDRFSCFLSLLASLLACACFVAMCMVWVKYIKNIYTFVYCSVRQRRFLPKWDLKN